MNWHNTPFRYGSLSIGLHWLMLLLFVAVYGSIELRELFEKGSDPREMLKSWHFMLGITVFILVWLRIAARLGGPAPAVVPEPEKIQQLAAKLLHLALYVLMIAMPISGYLLLSAAGKPIPFFGLELPALIDTNKELAKQIKEVHEFVGSAGYFLIGAHFVAALYHHFIVRDNTLTRMLPEKK
ncbi:MAG: cytochrome b [Gammaproteobacteria bacterium]|nr:cytochrome b [Gammaproteobacteria bacterium]MBU1624441.1 cytochrome b [Gammaproteobacteria bacterium]MBU1981169.1 cytochrome b [Gammaproteobacteria bacterium]